LALVFGVTADEMAENSAVEGTKDAEGNLHIKVLASPSAESVHNNSDEEEIIEHVGVKCRADKSRQRRMNHLSLHMVKCHGETMAPLQASCLTRSIRTHLEYWAVDQWA
jgi:hypothetical protein